MQRDLRDLRLWQAYATITTLALTVIAASAFRQQKYDQIDAQRINIVGPDGALQMVISNRQDMPEGRMDGKTFASAGRHDGAGMIFYNALGDEDGGLTFGAVKQANGYSADSGLLFDQLKQDQTVGLTYSESDGKPSSGLRMWSRPARDLSQDAEHVAAIRAMPDGAAKTAAMAALHRDADAGKFGSQRLFAGRMPDEASTVLLADAAGHTRLRLQVTAAGAASIEFLDAHGNVTNRLPH